MCSRPGPLVVPNRDDLGRRLGVEGFELSSGTVMEKDVPVEAILTHRGSPDWLDGPWGNQEEFLVMH